MRHWAILVTSLAAHGSRCLDPSSALVSSPAGRLSEYNAIIIAHSFLHVSIDTIRSVFCKIFTTVSQASENELRFNIPDIDCHRMMHMCFSQVTVTPSLIQIITYRLFGISANFESQHNSFHIKKWIWKLSTKCRSLGCRFHYNDIIMGAMVSQITNLTVVYSTVYSGADQRNHQSSASLAFVRGIYRRPVNSPHKWPVTQKMFPYDDVIMQCINIFFVTWNDDSKSSGKWWVTKPIFSVRWISPFLVFLRGDIM